jgi:hypothetical protein
VYQRILAVSQNNLASRQSKHTKEYVMPAENQSGKLGGSSSPVMDRVIDNSKNSQREFPSTSVTDSYNKKPVDVPGGAK